MRIAVYLRTSTLRQAQAQSCEQQLDRLRHHIQTQGWQLSEKDIFRDDGYSGASLKRPGLDHLRDHTAAAAFDRILITAPDRLARNYVHQVLLLEEFQRSGCTVEFLDRPMSQDPHDQLLLQIRGAVADEDFRQRVQLGLSQATFEQKRQLLELLVDRVVVTQEEVEIRYVIPTSPKSEKIRFCQLRSDYFDTPFIK